MKSNGKRVNVIMIGPDTDVKGGISFVISEYLKAGLDKKVSLSLVASHKDRSMIGKIFIFLKAFYKLIFLLITIPTPIVHLHVSQNGSFFRKLFFFSITKIFQKKIIIHLHGSEFEKFMTRNRTISFLTKIVFNNADVVIVISNLWKSKLERFSNNKNIIVLYNPTTLFERKNGNTNKVVVLFLGRLGKRKGIYDLLDCIIMNNDYFIDKNIRFILAGDGEVEKVRGIVKKEGLEKILEIPGWISGERKKSYLKTSDILILPSYNEQMPMSVLEAMGYGYPIVTTNIAGIPEMVEHGVNGFLIKPGDIKTMFEYLKQLYNDRDLRERMGRRSREIVIEKFDSKLIVDKLTKVYKELL